MAENGVRGQKVGLSFAVHHQHWQEDLSQTSGFVGKHSVIVSAMLSAVMGTSSLTVSNLIPALNLLTM